MLLSRQRRNKCIQMWRWPHISCVCSQLCGMWRTRGTGAAGGHRRAVWMADGRDDLLYDSHFESLSPSSSLCLSRPYSSWISHFLCFLCTPHYILKVNPINTEITLQDKLLREAFFRPDYHCMASRDLFCTGGNSYRKWKHSDTANHLFSLRKISTWNKGQMKEPENVPIYLIPLKCISFPDLFPTSHVIIPSQFFLSQKTGLEKLISWSLLTGSCPAPPTGSAGGTVCVV